MRSVEEALAGILAVARLTEVETLPLDACFGRVPASFQLTAALDVPPFDNSSMDGYALRAADTPGRLRLVGEVAAGAGTLPDVVPGTAARIMTGAPMPPGADAIAPIEVVEEAEAEVVVPATEPGAFVRRAGHDTRAGEMVTLP
ncbi:MAG TPA: molybdopterin molybdenumtransferase MoeA, partial [Candidatus Limnocylindria bacterium]